jgi:hypothetical protein
MAQTPDSLTAQDVPDCEGCAVAFPASPARDHPRLKMVVVRRRWRELYVRFRSSWPSVIATVNVLAALGSMTIAGIALLVRK